MVMALVMDVSDAVGDGGGYARNIRRNISDLFSFYILCFWAWVILLEGCKRIRVCVYVCVHDCKV